MKYVSTIAWYYKFFVDPLTWGRSRNQEAANRHEKVGKLENGIGNLKLDGTKLREENVSLKAEIEQLKFQVQWKQTSIPQTQHKMLAVQQSVGFAENQPVLVKGVYVCLSSILKTLAKIDFTLQSIKLVLDCLGFFPKIWNRSWKVQHSHRLALEWFFKNDYRWLRCGPFRAVQGRVSSKRMVTTMVKIGWYCRKLQYN